MGEPAWQGAGQEVGLKIWRIVVCNPKNKIIHYFILGNLYTCTCDVVGDIYYESVLSSSLDLSQCMTNFVCPFRRVFCNFSHLFVLQKFEVKDWPKEDYGKFYSGDSYIILNVRKLWSFQN